jgi:hypothetical protein
MARGRAPRCTPSPRSRAPAPDLAAWFGRETLAFKTDVRTLKNLGLTYSRAAGDELSPRGQAYLRHTSGATTVG